MSIKYNYNERIFAKIDNKKKAYWLGMLYADGYILGTGHSIGIALKESDIGHLINFCIFMGFDNNNTPIRYYEKTKAYKLQFCRKTTYADLLQIGFTNKKSYENSTHVWDNIPEKFKKDFLLGLWDGDGSFGISKNGKQLASLIVNNEILCVEIVKFINQNLGEGFARVKHRTVGDSYPRIRLSNNKANIFAHWLYDGAISYPLKRKKDMANSFKEGTGSAGFYNNRVKGIYCFESGQAYLTTKECAKLECGKENPGAQGHIGACCRGEKPSAYGKHFRYLNFNEFEEYKNDKLNL